MNSALGETLVRREQLLPLRFPDFQVALEIGAQVVAPVCLPTQERAALQQRVGRAGQLQQGPAQAEAGRVAAFGTVVDEGLEEAPAHPVAGGVQEGKDAGQQLGQAADLEAFREGIPIDADPQGIGRAPANRGAIALLTAPGRLFQLRGRRRTIPRRVPGAPDGVGGAPQTLREPPAFRVGQVVVLAHRTHKIV